MSPNYYVNLLLNMFRMIYTHLQEIGVLLHRLYCAVMIDVYALIFLSSGVIHILCIVCGSE